MGSLFGGSAPSAPPPQDLTRDYLKTYLAQAYTAVPYLHLAGATEPGYGQLNLDLLGQSLLGYRMPGGGTVPGLFPGGTVPPLSGAPAGGNQILNWTPSTFGGAQLGGGNLAQTFGAPAATSFLSNPSSWNQLAPVGGVPGQTPSVIPTTLVEPGTARGEKTKTFNITDLFSNQAALQPWTSGYHPGGFALGSLANQASLAANPMLLGVLGQLQGAQAPSLLNLELNQQALEELQNKGQLTPQEVRALNDQTRAGFAARGNVMGNQALGAELLSRDAAVRQRLQQAQTFGMGVEGMNLSRNQYLGQLGQFYQTLNNPFNAVLANRLGQSTVGSGGGPSLFNPNAGQDLYNTNYNAQAGANIAAGNKQAGATSGALSSLGAVAGAVGVAL